MSSRAKGLISVASHLVGRELVDLHDLLQRAIAVLSFAQLAQRPVDGDGRRPGGEATRAAKARQPLDHPHHALLRQIIEVGVAELAAEATRQGTAEEAVQLSRRLLTLGPSPQRGEPGIIAPGHAATVEPAASAVKLTRPAPAPRPRT